MERGHANGSRWVSSDPAGHYESWFCRANHPSRPRAFWIRYTVFSPAAPEGEAVGELYAVAFDGETGRHAASRSKVPIAECVLSRSALEHRIGDALIDADVLRGAVPRVSWDLRHEGDEAPLLLLPEGMYGARLPRAKSLVPAPLSRFSGELIVDGERWAIDSWLGSQNHNWGSRHTDRYAWGQVAGFDDAPEAFLEVATAQLRLGPVMSPRITVLTLRLDGEELRFDDPLRAARARASYDFFHWSFAVVRPGARVAGVMSVPRRDVVAFEYENPPGGSLTCLNTKIGRCDLTVRRDGRAARTLSAAHRAAFEILSDASDHGVDVVSA